MRIFDYKFRELQKLVIKEILKGKFKEIYRDSFKVKIMVGQLILNIWIANESNYISTYESEYNSIALDFTQEEKEKVYNLLMKK